MKGEARGLTLLVAVFCALAVWASVSPAVDAFISLAFGALLGGLAAIALIAGGVWWARSALEKARDRIQPRERAHNDEEASHE